MNRRCTLIEGPRGKLRPDLERLLGWRLDGRKWGSFSASLLTRRVSDLVIADATAPEAGIVLRELGPHPFSLPSIAVVAKKSGARLIPLVSPVTDDFLLWPAPDCEVRERITRLLAETEEMETSGVLAPEMGRLELVGRAPEFVRVVNLLPKVAKADVSVLVTGETGTGKELVARAIHFLSGRRGGPFVPVDCAGIPPTLFENEVFGHARGAFTDARRDQRGLVEIAHGGVLFLDEIDSLPAEAQAKLLRFLQERTFRPLGQARARSVDVNVVAAANVDLREKVDRGEFRADLYFRLNVLRLDLPPLRERADDIALLARHFLQNLDSPVAGRQTLSRAAILKLRCHDWPGNVRELLNVVQRASILCGGRSIGPQHIVLDLPPDVAAAGRHTPTFNEARARAVARFERDYLVEILRNHQGNITHAARAAGKERRGFGRLVKKHGIDPTSL